MTLDTLTQISRIEFPQPLTLKRTKGLLKYLAINLPAEIRYTTESLETIYYIPEEFKTKRHQGSVSISGNIHDVRNHTLDYFSTKHAECDTSRIKGLQFQLVPEWDLEEYRPEVRQLWQNVRTQVQNYFSQ